MDDAANLPPSLLDAEAIAERVEALAGRIAPSVTDDTVAVVLLTGGLWFAALAGFLSRFISSRRLWRRRDETFRLRSAGAAPVQMV